jgi:hypothetical protein
MVIVVFIFLLFEVDEAKLHQVAGEQQPLSVAMGYFPIKGGISTVKVKLVSGEKCEDSVLY